MHDTRDTRDTHEIHFTQHPNMTCRSGLTDRCLSPGGTHHTLTMANRTTDSMS